MNEKPILTQERLKTLLHYNYKTGKFKRLISVGGNYSGSEAGCQLDTGYVVISVDRKGYLRSRLAFLYMEGYFPENDVDHINRVRNDDRWINLREATRSCNQKNTNKYKSNSSGVTGVYWDKINKKWTASVSIKKRVKTLGVFENKDDAVMRRFIGETENQYNKCNTTSTAYLYLKERNLI